MDWNEFLSRAGGEPLWITIAVMTAGFVVWTLKRLLEHVLEEPKVWKDAFFAQQAANTELMEAVRLWRDAWKEATPAGRQDHQAGRTSTRHPENKR